MDKVRLVLIVMILSIFTIAVSCTANDSKILWQIGSVDDNTQDLAFKPQNYAGFKQIGFFVVGHSDPGKDWPYLHPGPSDRWASERSCKFDIVFQVSSSTRSGKCELVIDLVDIHEENPPKLKISVNGQSFIRQLPTGTANEYLWRGEGGSHGEKGENTKSLTGKTFQLVVPFSAKLLRPEQNHISITTLTGNFMLYDAVALKVPVGTELIEKPNSVTRIVDVDPLPFLQKKENRLLQPIKVRVFHIGSDVNVRLTLSDTDPTELNLISGLNSIEILVEKVKEKKEAELAITVEGKIVASHRFTILPVRNWDIYLVHQTHLDAGYTEYQPDIEKKNWDYLETAIELSNKTEDWPTGSQFKWNPEVTWAVESYLENASEQKQKELINAVKKGWIGLDALYMNELTGVCSPQELFHLVKGARNLNKKYGLKIDSAMIGDVPGCTWGVVEALSKSGIKYFNMGINYWPYRRDIKYGVDWGGTSLKEWGDKPFYWLSQSGKEKILFWMNGRGYCWLTRVPLDEETISFELKRLEKINYPYDITYLRHTIGGDNGPPYPEISKIVKEWNEKYVSPKIIISTNSEMFHKFEARYGDHLPIVSGDFTPHWERVIAVGAEEAIASRAVSEKLLQSQSLWAMLNYPNFSQEIFDSAWRGLVTFNEHTWGCLVFLPEEKRRKMWEWKKGYLTGADSLSNELYNKVTLGYNGASNTIEVFNTCSWPRSDLVILSKDKSGAGDIVRDMSGYAVPSQRLHCGNLAFMATDIPAFGAKRYTVNAGNNAPMGNVKATMNRLSNDSIDVAIDETSGAIKALKWLKTGTEFTTERKMLNNCSYVSLSEKESVVSANITVENTGPLVASLRIESGEPGNHQLIRRLQLVDGLDYLYIANTMGVEEVHKNEYETVQFSFEFAIDDSSTHLDIPWTIIRTGTDQLPGSCDSITLTSWFDVSNENLGATCAVLDAPLVEFEPDKNEPLKINSIATRGYGLSHYKDSYAKPLTFRYAIRPHGSFHPADATKFSAERAHPLVAVNVDPKTTPTTPLLEISPADIIVTALKPASNNDDIIVQLYNLSGKSEKVNIISRKLRTSDCLRVDPDGDTISVVSLPFEMANFELVSLRLQRK